MVKKQASMVSKKRFNISLTEDQYVFLKELAERQGASMSSIIRRWVEDEKARLTIKNKKRMCQ